MPPLAADVALSDSAPFVSLAEGNGHVLEFAAACDHAEHFSDNQWRWMQDVTNAWNAPGRFVTLVGYEWGGIQKDRNVYTSRSQLALMRGNHPGTASLDVFWGRFHADDEVVGGPHAPMVHRTVWEFHDPTVERFVEIYSMWGASDLRDSPLTPDWIEPGRGMTVNEILGTGAKLGFTGGGDCHQAQVGFSCEDPGGQGLTPHTFATILLYRSGLTASGYNRKTNNGGKTDETWRCLVRFSRTDRHQLF